MTLLLWGDCLMRDLKIVNGDLSFIDYGILLVEGDLELAQSVFMILSIRLEEFKLDTSVGLEVIICLEKLQ